MFLNSLADELKLEEVRDKGGPPVVVRNIINELFQGNSRNTMKCEKCKHERTKSE